MKIIYKLPNHETVFTIRKLLRLIRLIQIILNKVQCGNLEIFATQLEIENKRENLEKIKLRGLLWSLVARVVGSLR